MVTATAVAALAACASASTVRTPAIQAADSAVAAGLAMEDSLDPVSFPPRSVGVLPLTVTSPDPALEPLGHGLAVLLSTDLARSASVEVVERLRVDALLREASLAEAGVIDPSRAPRAGRILGARYLVVGSVSAGPGDDLLLNARLAETLEGAVQPVVTGTASVDEVLEAEKAVAFGIFEALGVTLTPAERAAIERRPTRHLGALLAFSRAVRAESELRLLEALREYREAIRLDPSFGVAAEGVDRLTLVLPDPFPLAARMVDLINPSYPLGTPDVADPAFHVGSPAVLVIPIIVR